MTRSITAPEQHNAVMPGLAPGIHVFSSRAKSWMAGTSSAMTVSVMRA
jgi:hypothetical protein